MSVNSKAIVTIALGKRFIKMTRNYCQENWEAYAEKHGYDVIFIEDPLDTSERARKRSASWQKLLVCSQDRLQKYERIVWVDADVLINPNAPDIAEGVPLEKIGAVNEREQPTKDEHLKAIRRMYRVWGVQGLEFNESYAVPEYYKEYGIECDLQDIVQCGIMVWSPKHHAEFLKWVYDNYEDNDNRLNYEMRPTSYEILKNNLVHWLDPRFNKLMHLEKAAYYPLLLGKNLLPGFHKNAIRKATINTIFFNNYFLHFIGCVKEMKFIEWKNNKLEYLMRD